jgi:hypothetical protein
MCVEDITVGRGLVLAEKRRKEGWKGKSMKKSDY